jgi:hypothetical protein
VSISLSPEQRVLRARAAAYTRWSQEDPGPAMAGVREGFYRRFELQVDPEGELAEAERRRRAKAALKAHMALLALKSARARAKRAAP